MLKNIIATGLTAMAIALGGTAAANAGYVGPNESVSFWDVFYADEYSEVCIQGNGWSDIDLWVYDENGNLIGRSTSYGSFECVSFTPIWTGEFTVVVENEGKPSGSYFDIWVV